MSKRRSKGDGSIFRRADGLWAAQINVAPPGAPRKRKTVYGKTKAEARRKLAEVVEQHKAGNYTTTSMTFGAWLDYWLEHVVDVRPNTKATYARQVRLYIKPELGKVRLDRLNLDHPPRLKAALSKHSSGTVQNAHRLAGTAIQAAMERGLMTQNPFKIIRAPKRVKPKRRSLETAELDSLLELISGRPDEARWLMAVHLGSRQGECLGLTWDRVDFDRMTLDFQWQAQRIPRIRGRIVVVVEALPDVLAIWSGRLRHSKTPGIPRNTQQGSTVLCNVIGSSIGYSRNERHHNDESYRE